MIVANAWRWPLAPVVAGKARKRRRLYRRWFLGRFGPGRVYFPWEVSEGAW